MDDKYVINLVIKVILESTYFQLSNKAIVSNYWIIKEEYHYFISSNNLISLVI